MPRQADGEVPILQQQGQLSPPGAKVWLRRPRRVVSKQKISNPRPNSAGPRKLALAWAKPLSASPDERPAGTVIDELPSAVLDVAHAWAKRPARSSDCGAGNAAHDRTDGTSNSRTRDNAGCCSCALLRRLAGSGSEADQGCKDELAHGHLLCCR